MSNQNNNNDDENEALKRAIIERENQLIEVPVEERQQDNKNSNDLFLSGTISSTDFPNLWKNFLVNNKTNKPN